MATALKPKQKNCLQHKGGGLAPYKKMYNTFQYCCTANTFEFFEVEVWFDYFEGDLSVGEDETYDWVAFVANDDAKFKRSVEVTYELDKADRQAVMLAMMKHFKELGEDKNA